VVGVLPDSRNGPLSLGACAIDSKMSDMDILARIPGEFVGMAAQSLPAAETTSEAFCDARVQLPNGSIVVITFRRVSHRHGRSRHWFWSAIRAVRAESQYAGRASAQLG
jgi:hypothetical protein